MKRLILLPSVIATGMLLYTVPSFADDMTKDIAEGKDECLLVSKNCNDYVNSIQERISKLTGEIAKGTRVYTSAELQKLGAELTTANNLLNYLMNNDKPAGGDII